MRLELTDAAEIGCLISLVVGAFLAWGIGGGIFALGLALLYEARS